MKIKWIASFLAAALTTTIFAAEISDTLHITQGHLENMENNTLRTLNFNKSEAFELSPHILHIQPGDHLELTIWNHDSVAHEIVLAGNTINQSFSVDAGSATSTEIEPATVDVIRVKSASDKYSYYGLNTMIVVDPFSQNDHSFYWNLREFQVDLLMNFDEAHPAAQSDYTPEYFTINNQSYPHLLNDPKAFVKGQVGDTLTVYIYNTGWLHHNFHLHGYHARIAYSSNHPNHIGRWKDSVPIDSDAILVLEIVPHQAGMFPMHNHNLGATVGTNQYPNNTGITVCGSDAPEGTNIYPYGMVTRIQISARQ